jgi:hypothetical protein
MKPRIRGNSLRLRLTLTEVANLRETGIVQSRIEFAPGVALVYSLEGSAHARSVGATFDGHAIRVRVPLETIEDWVRTDRVGIDPSPDAALLILLEKDLRCLHKDAEPDAYPNPLMN